MDTIKQQQPACNCSAHDAHKAQATALSKLFACDVLESHSVCESEEFFEIRIPKNSSRRYMFLVDMDTVDHLYPCFAIENGSMAEIPPELRNRLLATHWPRGVR